MLIFVVKWCSLFLLSLGRRMLFWLFLRKLLFFCCIGVFFGVLMLSMVRCVVWCLRVLWMFWCLGLFSLLVSSSRWLWFWVFCFSRLRVWCMVRLVCWLGLGMIEGFRVLSRLCVVSWLFDSGIRVCVLLV